MATSKEYLTFILDQLSGMEGVTYRSMMGEYILYYRGKIAAYLCDDRLLVKPVAAARALSTMVKFGSRIQGLGMRNHSFINWLQMVPRKPTSRM